MDRGCIYVLENEYIRNKAGKPIYKIGITRNLPRRLGTLNTSLPENFKVVALFECAEYKKLEPIIKVYVGGSMKTKGGDRTEFFDITKEEILKRIKLVAKHDHVELKRIDGSIYVGRSSSAIINNIEKANAKKSVATNAPLPHNEPKGIEFTYNMGQGVVIKGMKVKDGFLVYKGSPVLEPMPCFQTRCKSERKLRGELKALGVISDGKLQCDYVFRTPSAAAGVMRGGSINGRKKWKAEDGRSYGEIFKS